MSLLVFVSSAMKEFKTERKAIHQRLHQAAVALPVVRDWAFEFTPPEDVPADESYLENVRNCDIFVLIFGAEGTRPAVLRECNEAASRKKPILALAQRQAGIDDAPPDVRRVLDGLNKKYRLFDDPAEVVDLVIEALSLHIEKRVRAQDEREPGAQPEPQAEPQGKATRPEHPGLPARRKFFDRDEVLKEITRLLGDEKRPVIWLGGEGGLGKTALALEAAWRNAWRFPGVLWIPFDRMPPTLGSILAVAERDLGFRGDGAPRQRCDQLASRGHLFVLDTLDEVLDAATALTSDAAQVMKWLGALPAGARVIVTCRRSPNLGACQAAPTFSELPEDAAVQLFVAAAGGPRAGYNPSNAANLKLIKRIYRELGRLPLALELAGARAQETGQDLQSLLEGLEEALREAELSGKDNARERSLAGCLGYSFKLVQDEAARAALAFLATFPAIDKRMADRLLRGDRELTRLAGLRIARQGRSAAGPYWHALPPVRRAARDWLGKKKVDHTLVEGAAYLKSLPDPAEIDADNAVEAMHRLLRSDTASAYSLIAKLNDILHNRGFWPQARIMRQVALLMATMAKDERAMASAAHQYAVSLHAQGELDEAEALYKRSLEIEERLCDQSGMASSYHNLGALAYARDRYDEAEALYKRSVEIFERLGDQSGLARGYHQLGMIAYARGQYDDAQVLYRRSLDIKKRLGDQAGIAKTQGQLGILAQLGGVLDQAEKLYKQGLAISERLGDQAGMARSYHQLGVVAQSQGRYGEAEKWYKQSLEVSERIGDRADRARTYAQLGALALLWNGDQEPDKEENKRGLEPGSTDSLSPVRSIDRAATYYEQAVAISRRAGDPLTLADHLFKLGTVYVQDGRWYDGLEVLEECLTIRHRDPDSEALADVIYQIARTHHLIGNLERARTSYRDALRLYQVTNSSRSIADCKTGLGHVLFQTGSIRGSLTELKEARDIYVALNDAKRTADIDSLLGAIRTYGGGEES